MQTCTSISALILVIIANITGIEAQKATSLTSKIKELAPIARLTNGIALETEILTHPHKTNDVIAEFLKIRSGEDLVKLKDMDVDEVVRGLGEIYSAAAQVPQINVDVQAFKTSFVALEKMKGYAHVLNDTSGNDVTGIGSDIANARPLSSTITNIDSFQKAADNLRIISENSIHININDASKGQLFPLRTAIQKITNPLVIFQNFALNFNALLHLHNTTTRLSGLANISELLITNLDTLATMSSELTALRTGVDELKPVIDKRKTIPQLTKTMQDTINIIKTATHLTPEMKLAVGFSGDPNMIAEMFQDLKAAHLKKIVSQGKDLKGMADSLKILSKFQSKLQTVHRIWSAAVPDNWTSTDEAVQVLSGMAADNKNAPDPSTVSTTLTSIQQCFSNFQRPNTAPNLADVSSISNFASDLSQRILEWKIFFEEKKSDFGYLSSALVDLDDILEPINDDPRNPKRKEVWNSIKNQTDNMKTISILESIHEGLDRLSKNGAFTTIKGPKPDSTVISDIVSSLNEVNLPSLLTCVAAVETGLPDITTMLTIGSSVQAMKTKKPTFLLLQTLFSEVAKVKDGVADIGKTVKSGRRRKRSSKSLNNLKNAQEVSYNLGLGVQVLHKYAEILEKEGSVMVAVDAVDPLASAVAAIPRVQTIWTNRKSMGVMINDLKKLEATAGNLKKDSLQDLWKIFSEANLVSGVSIDAKLFDDPISKQLAQNSDPAIQAKSSDFKEIGSLDLNFVQHLVNLQKASQTLAPLQTFFDDYFDNKPGGPGAAGAGVGQGVFGDDSFPIGTVIVSICLFILFAGSAVAGVYYLKKHLREKEKWENREWHWFQERSVSSNGAELDTALSNYMFPTVTEVLKKGRYIDYYRWFLVNTRNIFLEPTTRKVWSTNLYYAVELAKPAFVDDLVRAGADWSLRSSDGLTPQQLLKRKLEQCARAMEKHNKDAKSKKKPLDPELARRWRNLNGIADIFKKYEKKKKIRPKVCDLVPLQKLQIEFRRGVKNGPKFEYELGHLVSANTNLSWTHFVCKVDADGVVDVDDLVGDEDVRECEVGKVCIVLRYYALLIKDTWVDACLKDARMLYKDHEFLINKVRYNGKVYDTVQEWQKWAVGYQVPCLHNVRIAYVLEMKEAALANNESDLSKTIERMDNIIARLGAERVELKNLVNDICIYKEQRPYWFPELNCNWILYPAAGKKYFDLRWEDSMDDRQTIILEQDPPLVIMTFEEFFDKLLSLNGYKDLLAKKYPNGGEKDAPPGLKDETPTKGSTEQTKTGSAEQSSRGSNSMRGSAEGSKLKKPDSNAVLEEGVAAMKKQEEGQARAKERKAKRQQERENKTKEEEKKEEERQKAFEKK